MGAGREIDWEWAKKKFCRTVEMCYILSAAIFIPLSTSVQTHWAIRLNHKKKCAFCKLFLNKIDLLKKGMIERKKEMECWEEKMVGSGWRLQGTPWRVWAPFQAVLRRSLGLLFLSALTEAACEAGKAGTTGPKKNWFFYIFFFIFVQFSNYLLSTNCIPSSMCQKIYSY